MTFTGLVLQGSAKHVCSVGTTPVPSCPAPLAPQHWMPPLSRMAQVCPLPTAMARAGSRRPTTSTGVGAPATKRLPTDPSPRAPPPLYPQHLTPPEIVTAQACTKPAAIAFAPSSRFTTSPGTFRLRQIHWPRSSVVPSPSSALPLSPQQAMAPVERSANVRAPSGDRSDIVMESDNRHRYHSACVSAVA